MTTANRQVMVVTAHPDDPEFLANGNKGSSDRTITSQRLAPMREEEQRRAAGMWPGRCLILS